MALNNIYCVSYYSHHPVAIAQHITDCEIGLERAIFDTLWLGVRGRTPFFNAFRIIIDASSGFGQHGN